MIRDEDRAPGRLVTGRRVEAGTSGHADFTYSVVEFRTEDRAGGERRSHRRLRTRLRDASLAERRGRTLVECRIRDRSEHGARLQLDEDRPLPPTFLLTDAAVDTSFRATLIWQTGREAGVRLVALV